MQETFADVLGYYVQHSEHTTRQVAKLSRLPHRTVANWMNGVVLKPQQWQGVAKVAAALKLSEVEASRLLEAAGHPPIAELRQTTNGNELNLLAPWPPPAHAPFQAVADLPYFVGREGAMRELERILLQGQHVAICNLHGMGGVGKTSLAAHLAYRLRAQFPDGVLWARLDTTDTMTILSAFADAYGKNVNEYRDVESRSAVVRNLLAGKRALLVLDNAANSEQVRPLLPPTTGKTAVLLTTRYDLAVADQMHRFPVESFDPNSGESLALFRYFLGQPASQHWFKELQAIADLLGHLPLAIAIAAGQLAYGRVPIPTFLAQLQQSEQRLDALIREDRSVRLSFDLSYRALSPEMQGFFAALGAFGGDDFGVTAVAYITHTTAIQAQKILDQLHHLSFVQIGIPGRYRLHPLLRDYAREQITSENAYADMATFYIELAESTKAGDFKPLLPETSNILACLKLLHERQMYAHLLRALKAFNTYLHAQGLNELQEFYLEQVKPFAYTSEKPELLAGLLLDQLRAEAQRSRSTKAPSLLLELSRLVEASDLQEAKNLQLKCDFLNASGAFHKSNNNLTQAEACYLEAFEIAHKIGSLDAAAKIKINHGLLFVRLDDEEAITYHLDALPLARQHSSYHVIITCLLNLTELYHVQGNFEQAEIYLDEAEELARQHGHRMHYIGVLGNRAQIAQKRGDIPNSERYHQEAATIAREVDHWSAQVPALIALANISRQWADFQQAEALLREALAVSDKQDNQSNRLSVWLNWGELYLAEGQWQAATETWTEVLEKSVEINSLRHTIGAYHGLARTAEAQNNNALAAQHTQSWQALYAQLNRFEKMWFKQWLPDLPVEG
jgi:tetratricopeptide (TPR) repeat protein